MERGDCLFSIWWGEIVLDEVATKTLRWRNDQKGGKKKKKKKTIRLFSRSVVSVTLPIRRNGQTVKRERDIVTLENEVKGQIKNVKKEKIRTAKKIFFFKSLLKRPNIGHSLKQSRKRTPPHHTRTQNVSRWNFICPVTHPVSNTWQFPPDCVSFLFVFLEIKKGEVVQNIC